MAGSAESFQAVDGDATKHVVAPTTLESSGHRAGRQHDLFDVLWAEELGR